MPNNIYNFVKKEELDVVMNSTASSRGLPNACYINSDYMQFEKNKLFEEQWTVIGTASSISNIGDIKSFNFQGTPLMLVRDDSNQIRVYHNVCSHRGMQLIKDNENLIAKKMIRCPYHSWAYDLSGNLIATPHIGGLNKHKVDTFSKESCSLKGVKAYVWLDLIFVNLSGNAINFEEFIKPLKSRWNNLLAQEDQDMIRHPVDYGYVKIETKCNWKFPIENYCESYHLPSIHPDLNKYSKLSDHHDIISEPNIFAGQDTITYNPQFENIKLPTYFPSWPKDKLLYAEYIALYPNVMLGIHKDHYFACWLEPISTELTIEHMEFYYFGDEVAFGDNYAEYRQANMELWKRVFLEDLSSIEGMQKGRHSPAFKGGVFSSAMDTASHMFHKWVACSLV
jgi:choline monooxygenase